MIILKATDITIKPARQSNDFFRNNRALLAILFTFVLILGGCRNEIPAGEPLGLESPRANSPVVISSLVIGGAPKEISVGDGFQLGIVAKTSADITISDVGDLVKCASDANDVISVADNCNLLAVAAGVANVSVSLLSDPSISNSVEITVLPIIVEMLPPVLLSALFVGEVGQPTVQVKMSDDSVVEYESAILCTAIGSMISISEGCLITGIIEGELEITVSLPDELTITEQVMTVKVIAASDLIANAPFAIYSSESVYEHRFTTDVFSTYKIKVIANQLPVPTSVTDTIGIEVIASSEEIDEKPVLTSITSSCRNMLAADKRTVACGVDTTDSLGFIYVYVDVPEGDFSGALELTFDQDVLDNDNKGVKLPLTIDDYIPLQVGSSYEGHVSSNAAPKAATESRFYTDVNRGLDENAPGHLVTVTFKPNENGAYNFDVGNVKVGWEYLDSNAGPSVFAALEDCVIKELDKVECNIDGGQADLFVLINGNGSDPNGAPSPATADGELSYTVLISNKLP